ncbi:hypothetical protein C3941_23750 [Kaistia algarum]|uniref:hypothetical protein n=1 Tax=Kaistia algarum TaxID=2083279 RepID=UPI000CE79B05|nr:hypothetical protein [Kaistia algarum]MCX5513406.1 hypothetical protein [Kaistia algarum]PPE77413.1 hypothetical protein C3941_23750 [Kaistia algarum]
MTVTAPQLAEADRASCTAGIAAKLGKSPYVNTEILKGALRTCDVRKAHAVAHGDDLAAVLAGNDLRKGLAGK